jgi:type II secretory pathway pseudopilin PulG
LRSIRSSRRAATGSERGFVLAAALIIAVLYFALMELLLMDSSRALHEAQRFRSQVIADALAESAAEMAAMKMVADTSNGKVDVKDDQGTMTGTRKRSGNSFELTGEATAIGVPSISATATLKGTIDSFKVVIDYATHEP